MAAAGGVAALEAVVDRSALGRSDAAVAGAAAWLLKFRAPSGANVYRFDHPGPYPPPPYRGAKILSESTTCKPTTHGLGQRTSARLLTGAGPQIRRKAL